MIDLTKGKGKGTWRPLILVFELEIFCSPICSGVHAWLSPIRISFRSELLFRLHTYKREKRVTLVLLSQKYFSIVL